MANLLHPDAELFALAEQRNRLVELRDPLRVKANQLGKSAIERWEAAGHADFSDWDGYMAICKNIGMLGAEDALEAVNEKIYPLDEKIRAIPVQTAAGLKVKLDLLRDFHVLLFNELSDEIERLAAASPIMVLFEQWNALRDHSDEDGISDDELSRRCRETDAVMEEIGKLPATSAVDFAAKLSCITHYGAYDDLGGDCGGVGSALICEAAALCGHPEKVARVPRDHQARGRING